MKTFIPLVIFLVSGLTYTTVQAQDRPMYEIHSMMLYNFTKYIQWPDNSSNSFVIAVLGDDKVYETLKSWYSNKAKGAKKFSIVKFNSVGELGDCDILYVARGSSKQFEQIQATLGAKPTLIITDKEGLGKRGSDINFKLVNNRLALELNKAALDQSNLKVSSQLMNIAILI